MKLTIKENKVPLSKLKYGETFLYEDKYYLVVDPSDVIKYLDDKEETVAVNLYNQSIWVFENNELVTPVNAELIINA